MSDDLTMDRRPHVVVVNRWREHYALYDEYFDHRRSAVSYISTAVGTASVPAGAAAVEIVDATDDLESVRAAAQRLARRFGDPDAVLALKEDDLLVGAALRKEWGCPGPTIAELLPFRDKAVMCTEIQAAGLDVPAFAPVWRSSDIEQFANTHGWPVVVKPRMGSSSAGVHRVGGPEDLDAMRFVGEPMLVQEFCDLPTYHVDGLFDGRKCLMWRVSRYTSDCLSFRDGRALGSVEIDDDQLHGQIGDVAARYLGALTRTATVFHLELFVNATSFEQPKCRFLEVGARAGGAEIPLIWREVHGYDLMAAATALQQGIPAPPVPNNRYRARRPVAGWLLVPAPARRPCRITAVTSMLRRAGGPYAEVVLDPGQVLPAADSYYEHVGGRFRFRAASTEDLVRAINRTAAEYRVTAEELPLDAGRPAPLQSTTA